MTQFLPNAQLGAYVFSSGVNPKAIDGQKRTNYVREHEVPGGEGGNIEYAGSQEPAYRLQGFFAPLNDSLTSGGIAGAVISGQSAVQVTPEQSISYFVGVKGSGAQLLQLESTWSRMSGYPIMYENDFFYIQSEIFAMEPGRGYSYYPYTLDLMRATYRTYGQSSGAATFPSVSGVYLSGYVYWWTQTSGLANGETIIGLGVYVPTVASGHARVALFSGTASPTFHLIAASASQIVHSGWNYFPINPSFTTASGQSYTFGFLGDVANTSGYTVQILDAANTSGTQSNINAVAFANGFSAGYSPTNIDVSGIQFNQVFVVQA